MSTDRKIVHDLAMLHVSERYRAYCKSHASFPDDEGALQVLTGFYYDAVKYLVEHHEELDSPYRDEDGEMVL